MRFLAIIAVFFVASCVSEKSVFISYDLPEPVKTDVLSQGHYYTMDGDVEALGTITKIHFINEYSQNGDKLHLNRTFISDASEGYLKKSHPAELALRTPVLSITAQNLKVISIEGYENFDSVVVKKVSIPDRWRKQISQMTRQIDLDRIERRRWDITHLLLGEVPLKTNVTKLLVSQGRIPNLANAQIDSVVTKGISRINGKKCLEYTVYLQEKEPFPYFIWEQHVSSVKSGEPFKSYRPKEAVYRNSYEVYLDLETGIPCLEREIKIGIHGMQNPESGDSVTFESQISNERFYTFVKIAEE